MMMTYLIVFALAKELTTDIPMIVPLSCQETLKFRHESLYLYLTNELLHSRILTIKLMKYPIFSVADKGTVSAASLTVRRHPKFRYGSLHLLPVIKLRCNRYLDVFKLRKESTIYQV